jgi:hypothetical protein
MDVLSLRTELETTLVDVLGTYRLANGATTPAISVRSTGDSLPAGTTVTGLECVILRDPELVPIRQYSKEPAFARWTLYLVQWTDEAVSLQDVAGRLLWAYPGSNAVSIRVPQGVGPRHQMRVDIQTNPDRIAEV